IVWQKVFAPKNSARHFSVDHDYILVYARAAEQWRPQPLPRTAAANARYANPDQDPRGPWSSGDMPARNYYSAGRYTVTAPGGQTFEPALGTYWRFKEEKFWALHHDGRIWWGGDRNSMPRYKRFLSEVRPGMVPQTLWKHQDVGH